MRRIRHFRGKCRGRGQCTVAALECRGRFPPEAAPDALYLTGSVVCVLIRESTDDAAQQRAHPVHLRIQLRERRVDSIHRLH